MIADFDTVLPQVYPSSLELLPEVPEVPEPGEPPATDPFTDSREAFEGLIGLMGGDEAAAMEHGELEQRVQDDGREILRVVLANHLALRAGREQRLEAVEASNATIRRRAERGHCRKLSTLLGTVEVPRIAYRGPGECNLHPADGHLNLPRGRYSHGLTKLAAIEATRGSYDDAAKAIERSSAQLIGKRQLEELAYGAARDFEDFYATRRHQWTQTTDLLVLSVDGKGIVMRPEALREPTRRKARSCKLGTRLSRGEKRNRKRICEVGAVYGAVAVPRTPADIVAADQAEREAAPKGPKAKRKWLTASVSREAAEVIADVFKEADRRDPAHERTWVALVDGNAHQIQRIESEARSRGVAITVVIDFVHVMEYVWSAAWSFHDEGDPEAEKWVGAQLRAILAGKARTVAASIRRAATKAGLAEGKRAGADRCASYLTNKAPYLDYAEALRKGWPIATGVIEGACRHLVKDRMDLTGARWGLERAEAILKLRAIVSNGDFEEYWRFHLAGERRRVHESRFAGGVIPGAPGRAG